METLFLALSDKTRLRILNLMRENETSVNFLTEVLRESQPKISRHLSYLRNAGLVSTRRDGKWIYYRIENQKNPFAESLIQSVLEWLKSQKDLREEYEKNFDVRNHERKTQQYFSELKSDAYVKADMKEKVKEELEVFLL